VNRIGAFGVFFIGTLLGSIATIGGSGPSVPVALAIIVAGITLTLGGRRLDG
jgi:hypothetical protein